MKHWRRLLIVLIGALSIALLANLARSHVTHQLNFQGERFKQLASSESSSTSDRVYFLKSALAIWADYPLGGSGGGTYASLHPKYQYRVISAGVSAHNFYVQTLAELGAVGFLLLILVLAELARGVVRGVKADPLKLPLALGLLAMLLHAGVDIDASYPVLWALAVILAGLCYLPSDRKPVKAWPTALILILAVALSVPAVWLFQGQTQAQAGQISQDNGDFGRAADYYFSAHSRPLYDPDWLTAEGINLYLLANQGKDKAGNLNEARRLAEAAQRLDSADGQHDLLLGRVLLLQGQVAEAEKAYRSAVSKDPYNHPDYYNDLATLYLQQNKFTAADQTAAVVTGMYTDQVIGNRNADATIAPAVATSYAIRAQASVRQGQTEEGRQLLKQALKLDPHNAAASILQQQIGQ